jgi:cysteine desulfurase/selenocysteine lyase
VLDAAKIREDFPILSRKINGRPLIYFDSAATAQMPRQVMEATARYYSQSNANVYRGVYSLADESTAVLEQARQTVRAFIGAKKPEEIIFTSGATDALNALAAGLADTFEPGDEILVTGMEHHANFVPWQMLCKRKNLKFRVAPLDENGNILMDKWSELLKGRVKLTCISHISNVTGIINPIAEMIKEAHENGALAVIDGAQGIAHEKVDVSALDCDFYCFSGHKLGAEMGTGVLFGKEERLRSLASFRYGGEMVGEVTPEETTFAPLPFRLEAGTPNVGGICSLAEALRYIEALGRGNIAEYEKALREYAEKLLKSAGGVRILGSGPRQAPIISFVLDGIDCYDAALWLDGAGIALRSGTHCAQPLLRHFGLSAALRISLSYYNTFEELDCFARALGRMTALFHRAV